MLGIPLYLWRLLPGNPILLRVVAAASKRKRDLFARCLYPGLLIGVVLLAITSGGGTSLNELTTTSEKIFRQMSYLQLALVALLAPIFTAGAITQEKDAQTYDILLATPLSNGQIVLGTLGSRLFFIIALLLSGIPIFAITKIFGGVAIGDVAISCGIAAATACVTGALATAIATFKVGTRRTIFGFYMVVVIYLIGGYLLDNVEALHPLLLDPNTNQLSTDRATTSWLSGVHPFLALQTLFAGARPPDAASLPPALRVWPIEWYFTQPATFFPAFMVLLSTVLVLPSIVLLRRMAQSTTSWRQKFFGWIPIRAVQAGREPRTVWRNPIAWREGRTKASSARASVVRYSFATLGIGAAVVLVYLYASEPHPPSKFIQAGSYNPTNQTLYINGENQSYDLANPTKVTIDQIEKPISTLFGRYEVVSHQVETVRGGKRITAIELARVAGRITDLQAHQLLLGLVIVELSVILLVVTNAAASAVTREREDGTLDLLLTTPITSRYYLWGKLIGLIVFVSPLLLVPVLSVTLFVAADIWKAGLSGNGSDSWLVLPEAAILLPLVSLVVVAFATIVGMQMSLRNRTTVRAVMSSLGIVAGCVAMLGWCGFAANASKLGVAASIIQALSPLGVIAAVIYPTEFGGPAWMAGNPDDITQARWILIVATLLTTAAYAAAVWAMYTSMVKNFDMTIRRQSR